MKMPRGQAGITLVEIIVSLAILGIIITPLSSFFVNTIKTNMLSRQKLVASQLAQRYIEEYKGKSFTELSGLIDDDVTTSENSMTIVVQVVAAGTGSYLEYNAQVLVSENNIIVEGNGQVSTADDDLILEISGTNFNLLRKADGVIIGWVPLAAPSEDPKVPFAVKVKQEGNLINPINLDIRNSTNRLLVVTKIADSVWLKLTSVLGQVSIRKQQYEETKSDLLAETGLLITVSVSRDGKALARLEQLKKIN